MVVTTVLRNIKDTGYPLRVRVWSLLTANVWSMGFSDIAMVCTSGLVIPLQYLSRTNGLFRWERGGIVLQSIFEVVWLGVWIK
jgi:sterol O-acyltransferase